MANQEIKITITGDGSSFTTEAGKVKTHLTGISDQARRTALATEQMSSSMAASLKGINGQLASLAGGFSAFQIGKDILNTNRSMEMLRAQLTAITGSVTQSAQAFKFIQDFAVNTPFEIDGLTKSFIMLQNFGIRPTQEVMSAITNQAAKLGASQETLAGITMALGQAYSKGKLQAEEMNQLTERGVPIMQLLTEVTGKGSAALLDMAQNGELTRDVMDKVIKKMGELANGSNAAAMQTLNGHISNLSDAWHNFEDTLLNDKSEGLIKNIVNGAAESLKFLGNAISTEVEDRIKFLELKTRYYQFGSVSRLVYAATGQDISADQAELKQLKAQQRAQAQRQAQAQQESDFNAGIDRIWSDARDKRDKAEAESAKAAEKAAKKRESSAVSAASKAAKAYETEREAVAKTIAEIQRETDLIGLSSKQRERATELTQALTKAKGAEVEQITQALNVKWQEIDADERRNAVWEESIRQANALDALKDSAADAQRLANLAQELKLQGQTNEQIKQRIDFERQLLSAKTENPDLDAATVAGYLKQRTDAENTLEGITNKGSQNSADFMESAFKKAAENIQDAMGDMFESLLNGDATRSFEDFFGSIRKMITKTLAQGLSQELMGAFTKGTNGSGASSGGMLSGLFDGITSLFGGSGTGVASQAGGFQGNGPLLSYANAAPSSQDSGFLSSLGSLFSSGSSSNALSGLSGFANLGKGGSTAGLLTMILSSIAGNSDNKIASYAGNAGLLLSGGAYLLNGALGGASAAGTMGGMAAAGMGLAGSVLGGFGTGTMAGNMLGGFAFGNTNKGDINLGSMGGAGVGAGIGFLMGGPLGALLGGLLGGAGGGLLGGLFGSKIPQPTEWTKGLYSDGKFSTTKSGTQEGGNSKTTEDFSKAFGDMITGLGKKLGMGFRDFRTEFWHQLDDKGENQFAGRLSDNAGTIYSKFLGTGEDFKAIANKAAFQVIRRNIDLQEDLHYREAIRSAKSLKTLNKALDDVDKIGMALGEYGPVLSQLKEINNQFADMATSAEKYRFSEEQLEKARQRAIDALKNDTITAYRQLAGMGASVAASVGDLVDQLISLEANAKTLKISEQELAGLRLKAIQQSKAAYLSPLTDAASSIADQIASITGELPTPEDVAPLYELLKQSTDPKEQISTINRISKALTQRYNIEIAAINKTSTVVTSLRDFLDSLKLSDISPLDPTSRLREAQGLYGTTLLKAQAGDQEALIKLATTAQGYLTEAKNFYASTPEYAAIFKNVTGTLEGLNTQLGGATDAANDVDFTQSAASAAADELAGSLKGLRAIIDGLISSSGNAFDQAASTVDSTVTDATTGPGKSRVNLLQDQIGQNISSMPADASKADRKAMTEVNRRLEQEIKAFYFGGDTEADKTKSYFALNDQLDAVNAQIKATKDQVEKERLRIERDRLQAQIKGLGKIQYKASGGWTQGPTIVGENGPELINFAHPTLVTNHQQTRAMLSNGNDAVVTELKQQTQELKALVKLQQASINALLERMDKQTGSLSTLERKARLEAAA